MSLSIFDVDGIGYEDIVDDENENEDEIVVKTFTKHCGYGTQSCLEVKVGEASKELCDNDAAVVFRLIKGADWTINVEDKHRLELIFRGYQSCGAFFQALEFAVQVLREARDRVMFQKEEKAF
ncbi:MAG: hypothetical protein IJ520_07930 [Synergistaceae bacterium]|nr:hypothetical protein [Synergistaceae bacterium]